MKRITWLMCAALLSPASHVSAQSVEALKQWTGRGSCSAATCHGGVTDSSAVWHSSATVWEAHDPHVRAGSLLQEPLARRILIALDPVTELDQQHFEQALQDRCVSCHAPEFDQGRAEVALSRQLIRGVGCESCHGAASGWLTAHTAKDFNPLSEDAQSLGMRDTKSLASRVAICASCHIGSRDANELVRDVNHDLIAAGHPRMLFDPLAMERKLPVHWNMRAGATMAYATNDLPELQRQARMVVLDGLARLKAARRASPAPLPRPEFSEFECRACHRSLVAEKGGA